MKKVFLLMLGALFISSAASAQQVFVTTVSPNSGYIGIRYDDTRQLRNGERIERVVIREVSKGSPAEKAGLRAGDEIVRINGLSTANGKFAAVARTLTVGDTVRLRIKRDGQERDYTVIAAERPAGHASAFGEHTYVFSGDSVRNLMRMYLDSARVHFDSLRFRFDSLPMPRILIHPGDSSLDVRIERFRELWPGDSIAFRSDSTAEGIMRSLRRPREFLNIDEFGPGMIVRTFELGSRAIAGAELTNLDPAMKTYFGTDEGLLTLRVADETPAARAGLQAGDVIVKANGRTVTRVSELRHILLDSKDTVRLDIIRKGEKRTLEVPLQGRRSNE